MEPITSTEISVAADATLNAAGGHQGRAVVLATAVVEELMLRAQMIDESVPSNLDKLIEREPEAQLSFSFAGARKVASTATKAAVAAAAFAQGLGKDLAEYVDG